MVRGSGCLAEINAYQGSFMSLKGYRLSAEVVSWGLTAIEFFFKQGKVFSPFQSNLNILLYIYI